MPFDNIGINFMAGRNVYGYTPSVGNDEHVSVDVCCDK
jgi:hypothetical protein